MDKRTIEFIRCLRAAGIRISLAESQDAFQAVDEIGIYNREWFKESLRTTLVKEHQDWQAFDYFFPLFFEQNSPPMWDMTQELSPDQQQMLREALQSLMGDNQALRDLLNRLMQGQPFSQEELDQMAQNTGMQYSDSMYQQGWFNRRMMREAALDQLRDLIEQLMEQLRAMGLTDEALEEIREMMEENAQALSDQISNYTGYSIAQNMAEKEPEPKKDVMDMPFQHLTAEEAEQVRDEIRRLAARLRARVSLRQKHEKDGELDPKQTIRHNLRYGGVPMELKHRHHTVKPRVVAICDLSGSMRYMSEFALTLTYMLQDLVAKARSFIFIDEMKEVTHHFKEHQPRQAVEIVLRENPRGYYSTDLGRSLATFNQNFMDAVDRKTTILFVGDGRNNFNDPRLDIIDRLKRNSRRLLWFCPEPQYMWGSGDSDMQLYAPQSDGVFLVRNLRELGAAIDNILSDS